MARSVEPLDLWLLTDGAEDKRQLEEAVGGMTLSKEHRVTVMVEEQLRERAREVFRGRVGLERLRGGHPCWRKLTDPFLLARDGEEVIILDPDVYFPNRFSFEATPPRGGGVLLMWQRPNCLLPVGAVEAAFGAGVRLADHVDIGVAQMTGPMEWEWVDWFMKQLGDAADPTWMHVEAIVWAALMMKFGGAHLNPGHWHCYAHTQVKRVRMKMGWGGARMLEREPLGMVKAFHAGGPAKYWLAESPPAREGVIEGSLPMIPVEAWTVGQHRRKVAAREVLKTLGYYRLMGKKG